MTQSRFNTLRARLLLIFSLVLLLTIILQFWLIRQAQHEREALLSTQEKILATSIGLSYRSLTSDTFLDALSEGELESKEAAYNTDAPLITRFDEKPDNCLRNCNLEPRPGQVRGIFIVDGRPGEVLAKVGLVTQQRAEQIHANQDALIYDSINFRSSSSVKAYLEEVPWANLAQLDTPTFCYADPHQTFEGTDVKGFLEFSTSLKEDGQPRTIENGQGQSVAFLQVPKYNNRSVLEVADDRQVDYLPGFINYDEAARTIQEGFKNPDGSKRDIPPWLANLAKRKKVPPLGEARSILIPVLSADTLAETATQENVSKRVWCIIVVLEAINSNNVSSNDWQAKTSWALPALSIFALFVVTVLVWQFTRPIAALSEGARRIAEGDFGFRVPVKNTHDEMGQLAASFNDMSVHLARMRELEVQLNQAERSAVVGRLASAIAHEIRNPLTYINLTLDHFRTALAPDDPKKKETFERLALQLKSEVSRINKHITELLNYARPTRLNLQPLNLYHEAQDAMLLIEAQAEEKEIVTKVRQSDDVPLVLADREWLRSILTNLMINSVQATNGHGGTLDIIIHKDDVKPLVYIDIADTGAGIPEEDLTKIFEPYFSTKETGTGLGLAIVKKAVEEHGGEIHVQSTFGRGTTFTIVLPSTRAHEFD